MDICRNVCHSQEVKECIKISSTTATSGCNEECQNNDNCIQYDLCDRDVGARFCRHLCQRKWLRERANIIKILEGCRSKRVQTKTPLEEDLQEDV